MSDRQKEHGESEAEGPEDTRPETPEAAAGESSEAPLAAGARVAELEAEVATLKDQLLRALAETENVRRRGQREREELQKYASAPLVKDLLEVADNLRRAIESLPGEEADPAEALANLVTGVKMTERLLETVFARHQIERIEPLGEKLDPHNHEAMFEIPDPEAPAGTIVQVMRVGYRLRDRLLRAAQVGVAGAVPGARGPSAANGSGEPPQEEPGARGKRIDTSV
jgi:molecular chaperone GrpE